MKQKRNSGIIRGRAGAALVLAVVLLGLFTTLGMLYIRYMTIEAEESDYNLRRMQARNIAIAGINAAIADLERARSEGQTALVLDRERPYAFNTYQGEWTGRERTPMPQADREAVATVTITDENAKINLNHAPASVLQAILGVDGETARRISGSMPRRPGDSEAARRWLIHLDDLLEYGLLSEEQFAGVDPALVTVDTVIHHFAAKAYININSAAAPVLAAILDIPIESAELVAVRRPFNSLAELHAAAGKDPATFNIRPEKPGAEELPAPLAVESRCFRIVSHGACASLMGDAPARRPYRRTTAVAEAVVLLTDRGPEIVRWSTRRGDT
jgi:type II secretory pathway component PulK